MFFIGIIEADPQVVSEVIQYFFGMEGYSVVFTCNNLDEYKALPPFKRQKANLLLLNSGENNFDRLWQVKFLNQVQPGLPVLILVNSVVGEYLAVKLREAGAVAFVHRSFISRDLDAALPALPAVSQARLQRPSYRIKQPSVHGRTFDLTARELEIVEMVARGHTNKKIGEEMEISIYTVNAHLRKIFIKCNVKSRTALVSKFMRELAGG